MPLLHALSLNESGKDEPPDKSVNRRFRDQAAASFQRSDAFVLTGLLLRGVQFCQPPRAERQSNRRDAVRNRHNQFVPWAAALILGVAASLPLASAAVAQEYPNKPVTLIVPWPAGGATDIAMRAIADAAAKHLGQPILIDNKAGGSGTVGPATMVASAKPDGYTISQIPITVFRLPLMQQTTWDAEKDFSYIVHLTGYTFGVTTNADSPFKKWQDVIDYAKANPGKVTYATPGAATSLHIGMEQIAAKSGVKFTQVPFKGNAESNAAVLGNHTMLQADGTGWRPLVDSGKLRLLMIWTAQRSKNWPDVPTMQELGYPFVFDSPFGIAGPKGMDPKAVAKLHDAFKKAIEEPALLETLAKYDMVANYKSTEDYRKFISEVIESERKVVDGLGLGKK
jgi:tripartite-type tricarboxylate transporter receptor subunit TctC